MSLTDTIRILIGTLTETPDDRTTWLVLADALREDGRDDEADIIHQARPMIVDGVIYDADLRTYTYREEGGYRESLDASDMDEAVEMAEELCRGGEWGDEGAIVRVWVSECDASGEETDERYLTVEIEPDHAAMIEAACDSEQWERCCGGDPADHDWTAEGEGGCRENPGVWSTGGTSMSFATHCRACGLHRNEYTCGSQRNPGEHDTVSYEMPDRWCAECQCEECGCEQDEE